MPIYMDVHIVPGVKAAAVAQAHQLDLSCQEQHGCKCMTYWIDEERENVFCLIEAPNEEAVRNMHNHAHGLMPNRIIEVNSDVVHSFLGRIYDPEAPVEDGLKIFKDPSYRILLLTRITDPTLLQLQLGKEKANELISLHNTIIRKNMTAYGGREAEYAGAGFIISFTSASKAVDCALAVASELRQAHLHRHQKRLIARWRSQVNSGKQELLNLDYALPSMGANLLKTEMHFLTIQSGLHRTCAVWLMKNK
jgi:hypothetical protein